MFGCRRFVRICLEIKYQIICPPLNPNPDNKIMGLINWFAVHATSMNATNKLISGDSKGLAGMTLEKMMNKGYLVGKGPFVAAFATANHGDTSPNILGSR